jgi:hypothetical protein
MFPHKIIDRYFWGQAQQSVLNDIIDCREMSEFLLKVNNNKNCDPDIKNPVSQQL